MMTEKIAEMMIRCSLATGHGDTVEDLLSELEAQIKELQARAEKAEALARELDEDVDAAIGAFKLVRNEALEEAAKCIEEDYFRAAKAIRALKGEPK